MPEREDLNALWRSVMVSMSIFFIGNHRSEGTFRLTT
jgi:hypothetical protein